MALVAGVAMVLAGSGAGYASADTPVPSAAIQATAVPTGEEAQKEENKFSDRIKAILHPEISSGVKRGDLYIPSGTQISLSLVDPVSSKKSKKGTSFRLKVMENLMVNGVVVIPKDQQVVGYVIDAHGNRLFGGGGKLVMNIPSIDTINGVKVPVNGYIDGHGGGDGGAVAVAAVASLLGGLFMKGKNIYYEPGQVFTVTVATDTDIEATPDNLATVMDPSKPSGTELVIKPR